ncbi:MAG: hypothetical protein ACI4NB_03760 [Candidatus Ornithospirochaeta sp.]
MTRENKLELIAQYAIPKKERERILNEIREHNFSIVRLRGGDISFSSEDITFIESLG